jgi:hypothetical protein
MRAQYFNRVVAFYATAVWIFCVSVGQAQITGILSSDVEGFFGAQSDAVQKAEGPTILPPWPALPSPQSNFPYGPNPLPLIGVRLYPTYPNYMTVPVAGNIPFDSVSGHAPAAPFTDGGTVSADYHLYGGYNGTGDYTRDAFVELGHTVTNDMYLQQSAASTGYAYEEEEFAIDYTVGPNGLHAGATVGTRPFDISGSFLPTGTVEFGASVHYWFQPTIPGTVALSGTPTLLGSLVYDTYLFNQSGSFSTSVPDNYLSNYLAGVPAGSNGYLAVTGDIYLFGDPVSVSVQSADSVPEPCTIGLLAMSGLMLVRTGKRLGSCR